VDLGTGDGRSVLARAAHEPTSLVIGLDANAAHMAEASRRAARKPSKGGLPNALFALGAAEAPPPELAARADVVTIVMPWGSLLEGVLGGPGGAAVRAGITALVAPRGSVVAYLSTTARDGRDLPDLDDRLVETLEAGWSAHGLCVASWRPALPAELAATGSSWARRLGLTAGRGDRVGRTAWRLGLERTVEREALR
jgi:16S rRNA (adenine(1408)-N(1))-methyltransferase